MKVISLQETATHYHIEIEREAMKQGPTIVQKEGQAIAVLLSGDDYEAFQRWQATQQKPLSPQASAAFEAEVAAFEQLKPTLLEQYPGQVVAIYQEQVVEVGQDKMEVLHQVQEKFGDVPCYIEWVEPEAPRRVRLPSVRVASR